jgi:hypothetical protein
MPGEKATMVEGRIRASHVPNINIRIQERIPMQHPNKSETSYNTHKLSGRNHNVSPEQQSYECGHRHRFNSGFNEAVELQTEDSEDRKMK